MAGLRVVTHPLLARHLCVLREATTSREALRQALAEASAVLAYEAMRDLATEPVPIRTPLEATRGERPALPVAVVAILRAGLGMVDGFLRHVPEADIGHLGMERDERTLRPVPYYESLPASVPDAAVFVVDPMLATGGSASAAITRLRRAGARRPHLVVLVAAPEGVAVLRAEHPDVPITAAALDRELDERGFIRPGLGDAGDRLFGTE
jgi:uracil phosphoribosyltransferase